MLLLSWPATATASRIQASGWLDSLEVELARVEAQACSQKVQAADIRVAVNNKQQAAIMSQLRRFTPSSRTVMAGSSCCTATTPKTRMTSVSNEASVSLS